MHPGTPPRNGHGELLIGGIPARECATLCGTPVWVIDLDAVLHSFRRWDAAFADLPHQTRYAVKANGSLAVLAALAGDGCGFDVNSAGELQRALRAGARPSAITMTGVGKSHDDIRAALATDIHCFNAESLEECLRIGEIASGLDRQARVILRINPDVDARTHPAIATGLAEHKFGIPADAVVDALPRIAALPYITVLGFGMHLGSQITDARPFVDGVRHLLEVCRRPEVTRCIPSVHLNIGGGIGVPYTPEDHSPDIEAIAAAIIREIKGSRVPVAGVFSEPGRAIVAHAGVLLARVEYVKRTPQRTFVILDAGMNDLIRPSLYDAWHEIVPVRSIPDRPSEIVDVVGPVCESGDTFAINRRMERVEAGDLVAILTTGAYGSVMSSTYNTRPLAPELCICSGIVHVTRSRQTLDQLLSNEILPDPPVTRV